MKLPEETGCIAIAALSFLVGLLVGFIIAYLILRTMPVWPGVWGPIF